MLIASNRAMTTVTAIAFANIALAKYSQGTTSSNQYSPDNSSLTYLFTKVIYLNT